MSNTTIVGKISIITLIIYLLLYIVLHYLIIMYYNKQSNKLLLNESDEKLKKNVKILKFLSKWFPAIYTVFVLIMLI
jgi:amino acid transporter